MIVILIRCVSMTVLIAMAHWSALIAEASGRHQQFQHSIICIWSFKPIRPILGLVLKLHTHSSMQVRSNVQYYISKKKTWQILILGCGGVIKKANLTISPPQNANGYAHRSNCKWIIVAPPGFLIELKFTTFDLEQYYGCRYDYVSIYDEIVTSETNRSAIGKYCGTEKPPTILSTTRALSIFFKADESVNGQGFLARYDFIDGRNCKPIFHRFFLPI